MLCRGMSPERAGGAFEGDAVPRSEGEDEAEIASLEDAMGNALKAARRSAVKRCMLKGSAKCDRRGWRSSYLC